MASNSDDTVHAIFDPLDTAKREIRLVTLQPAAWEDSIVVCSLETIQLTSTPPQYEALSWCWGDPAATEPMILQSETWLAPRNLVQALRALRRSYEFRTIWVDALCINQSLASAALRERGHQVQLMKHIYASAQEVVVWLGQAEVWTDQFFSSLSTLAKLFQSPTYAREEMDRHGREAGNRDLVFVKWLWEFIRRPWWRRAWIVQEVVLARVATVMCGRHSTPLHDVLGAFIAIERSWSLLHLSRADTDRFVSWNAYVHMQENLHRYGVSGLLKPFLTTDTMAANSDTRTLEESFTTLAHVLTTCRFQLASDPRDMIYGFLGMMPDLISHRVPPVYETPFEDVYIRTAFAIIDQTKSLFILSQAQISMVPSVDQHHGGRQLPSWVPDWSLHRRRVGYSMELRAGSRLEREKLFQASNGYPTDAGLVDDRLLRVSGIKIGTVNATHKLWQKTDDSTYIPNVLFFSQWTTRAASNPSTQAPSPPPHNTTRSARQSAWWRTFLHDMQPSELCSSPTALRATMPCIMQCHYWMTTFPGSNNNSKKPSTPFPIPSLTHDRSFTGIRFFTTTAAAAGPSGYLGLGNTAVQPGDEVFVLAGASHPFVLRPVSDGHVTTPLQEANVEVIGVGGAGGLKGERVNEQKRYKLVCECYVDGIMDGEAVRIREEKLKTSETVAAVGQGGKKTATTGDGYGASVAAPAGIWEEVILE